MTCGALVPLLQKVLVFVSIFISLMWISHLMTEKTYLILWKYMIWFIFGNKLLLLFYSYLWNIKWCYLMGNKTWKSQKASYPFCSCCSALIHCRLKLTPRSMTRSAVFSLQKGCVHYFGRHIRHWAHINEIWPIFLVPVYRGLLEELLACGIRIV